MNVLIACEESQEVCKAFRNKGHNAFSCDLQLSSGGFPQWHIVGDVLKVLNGNCTFFTESHDAYNIDGKWDLIIAHPPCTYLSNCCTRGFSLKCTPADKVVARWEERAKAAVFFMMFVGADCEKIAIENPVGFMSGAYRKPDQYINPWMFAESKDSIDYNAKKTGLWLKGLPKLKGNGIFKKFDCGTVYGYYSSGKAKTWEDSYSRSAKVRSKTFPGIAKAMAEQWG